MFGRACPDRKTAHTFPESALGFGQKPLRKNFLACRIFARESATLERV
jgi:hypothetical protein